MTNLRGINQGQSLYLYLAFNNSYLKGALNENHKPGYHQKWGERFN